MTESTYTVGPGRPPLHSRFQKGQSGNPGGRPGPAKQLKQRFHRALREALEKTPQALEAARPTSVPGAIVRKMVLDANAGSDPARQRVLSLLEREAGENQDWVTRLESERDTRPSFEEGPGVQSPMDALTAALFSLSEGDSQGENRARMQELLKILDEMAPEPKEQGGCRENGAGEAADETGGVIVLGQQALTEQLKRWWDTDHQLVIPAQAGTQQARVRARKESSRRVDTRRLGPRLRGDDKFLRVLHLSV